MMLVLCLETSLAIAFGFAASAVVAAPSAADVSRLLGQIRQVGPKGVGHAAAIEAARELSQVDASQLPTVLAAMDGANPLVQNWVRGIVEAIVQKAEQAGQPLPLGELEAFLGSTEHAPRARRLAYELIAARDKTAAGRLIPGMLDDPSLELRRDAVAQALQRAASETDPESAKQAYRVALTHARDVDQIDTASAKLKDLGELVDLPAHFGFVMHWHLIAPFDNSGARGFDVAYPPETEVKLTGRYRGKDGLEVSWTEHTTEDDYGVVNINEAVAKYMGAVAYAYADFELDEACDAQIRLGSLNGNKVWVNGQLIFSNHVYHSGMEIDQYVGDCKLRKGRNQILVKITQNEQTDDWAQDWRFQLRVCDQYGTAILARNRAAKRLARRSPARRTGGRS